jgi:hypothetical protein
LSRSLISDWPGTPQNMLGHTDNVRYSNFVLFIIAMLIRQQMSEIKCYFRGLKAAKYELVLRINDIVVWIRIQKAQKHTDPPDPDSDPDPQH